MFMFSLKNLARKGLTQRDQNKEALHLQMAFSIFLGLLHIDSSISEICYYGAI